MTHKSLLLLAAAPLALSACVTATGDLDRTRTGALAGAGAGDGDRQRNAAIGAALGAGAGATIGSVLDRQAAELRESLSGGPVDIINTGSELVVRLPQDVLFAIDSATVAPALRNDLQTISASLSRYVNSTIEVQGHTDNTGAAAYNQNLSERRAQSVAQILVQNGVNPGRVRAVGYGEARPIASNLTPEGRAQNRRVQIVIRPNG